MPNGGARVVPRQSDPEVFICPSATPPTGDTNDIESANYLGVAGSGESRVEWTLDERINGHVFTDGTLFIASRIAVSDITDGSSNTLAIGERSFFDHNRAENWTHGCECTLPVVPPPRHASRPAPRRIWCGRSTRSRTAEPTTSATPVCPKSSGWSWATTFRSAATTRAAHPLR